MKQPIKMTPGDDLHLSLLMAPFSLNLVTGQDRQHLLGYGRAAFEAGKAGQCLHQIQEPAPVQAAPAAVAVPDERAAFVNWLHGTYPHSYTIIQAADLWFHKHVAALAWQARAALAATPADHVADAGKMVAAASRTTGYVAPKGRYVPPVLFSPYTGEPRDARDIASDPQGVLIVPPGALLTASSKPAAETVVLPEPFTTLVRKTSWSSDCYEASPRSNAQEYGRQWADERINVYTEQQVRALLATATGLPAQAVHDRHGVTPNVDKWKLVDGDMRETCDGLLTYHADAYREGLDDAPQAQADARDAGRWRMASLIHSEMMKHPDIRAEPEAASAYMKAVHDGVCFEAAIDAAIAAAKGE